MTKSGGEAQGEKKRKKEKKKETKKGILDTKILLSHTFLGPNSPPPPVPPNPQHAFMQ